MLGKLINKLLARKLLLMLGTVKRPTALKVSGTLKKWHLHLISTSNTIRTKIRMSGPLEIALLLRIIGPDSNV